MRHCFLRVNQRAELPLLHLHLNLQEKIISKLEQKSYFRLQRTCKYINNLAKNNQHIKVFVDFPKEKYCTFFDFDDSLRLISYKISKKRYEMPYGVLLSRVDVPFAFSYFEEYCDVLKSHRITAHSMSVPSYGRKATAEQFTEIIKLLRPKEIEGDERSYPIPYESIFQFEEFDKIATTVEIEDPEQILPVLIKFISLTPNLSLWVATGRMELTEDEFYNLAITVIELLNSERFPRLWKLKLSIPYVNTCRPKEEKSLEIFQDFNPTIVQLASDTIELQCCLSNSQSYCRVALFTDSVEIKYAKDAAAIEVEPKPRIRRIPSFRRMWQSLWSRFICWY